MPGPEETWRELRNHPFFSGEPGPPGTEHLWGDYDYEDMMDMDDQVGY